MLRRLTISLSALLAVFTATVTAVHPQPASPRDPPPGAWVIRADVSGHPSFNWWSGAIFLDEAECTDNFVNNNEFIKDMHGYMEEEAKAHGNGVTIEWSCFQVPEPGQGV